MSKLEKRIAELEAQVEDLQAFAGVLVPVFEKYYKKQGYDFSVDTDANGRIKPNKPRA